MRKLVENRSNCNPPCVTLSLPEIGLNGNPLFVALFGTASFGIQLYSQLVDVIVWLSLPMDL